MNGMICDNCTFEMKKIQIGGMCSNCYKILCTGCGDFETCFECRDIFCANCSDNTGIWDLCRICDKNACSKHFARDVYDIRKEIDSDLLTVLTHTESPQDMCMSDSICIECFNILYEQRHIMIIEIITNKYLVKIINDYI